jgi:hypothetical protein
MKIGVDPHRLDIVGDGEVFAAVKKVARYDLNILFNGQNWLLRPCGIGSKPIIKPHWGWKVKEKG